MKKHIKDNLFYVPVHMDSGNRGCEAITRATIDILQCEKENIRVYTQNRKADVEMGLNNICVLDKASSVGIFICKVLNKIFKKRGGAGYPYCYKRFLDKIGKNAVTLITGGDLLCYGDNEVNYITNKLAERGNQVVLWGCSIGKENLTAAKREVLKSFTFITVRESLTDDLLRKELNMKNVCLVPDPAFILSPQRVRLPAYFKDQDIIGINLSNFVGADVGLDTMFGKNIIKLFSYIIKKTKMDIVLIPHVFWRGQNDKQICSKIYRRFKSTGRIHILDSESLSYCEIRYVISKCRFFVGARTHAMISAYSTCVPALALGYSVKAKGIAKDIGIPEELVKDYKNLKDEDELVRAFLFLLKHEKAIKNKLEDVIPGYRDKAYEAGNILKNAIGDR